MGSSALYLHVPRWASGSRVPLPVLHSLTLGKVGRVGAFLGKLISDTRGCEHVLRCAAGAMATKLVFHLVGAEISFILDLNGDALFMTHAGTPLTARVLPILLVQQPHGRTV